jgi:hypothetical protein
MKVKGRLKKYSQHKANFTNKMAEVHGNQIHPPIGMSQLIQYLMMHKKVTDHARRDSVKRYASVQLEARRRLLEGKQGSKV